MGVIPPLRKLQYVLAVARELHFRKAAEKLHVSQPALSRQISEYEEEIGFKILRRDHHFVSLTPAGQAFVSDVEQIMARMEGDFENALRRSLAISRERSSDYVLAHSPFAPLKIRKIALDVHQELFRDVPLRLRILSTAQLFNAIEDGIVQAGITFAPVDHPQMSSIPVGIDHWIAVVPSSGRFAHVRIANIAQFRGMPVISNGADRTHPALFGQLELECASRGFPFRTVAEITSPHEAFDLVLAVAGVVLLPAGVCEKLPQGLRAIRIADLPPLELVLIHRGDDSSFPQQLAARIGAEISLCSNHDGKESSTKLRPMRKKKSPLRVAASEYDSLQNKLPFGGFREQL